jgi:mono/diheme cytochrome c family protein
MKLSEYVDMRELSQLLASLLLFIGALAVFILFAAIVVPGLRNANRPYFPPSVDTVIGEYGWYDPTEDYPPEKGYVLPPLDPKTVLDPTPELLARGKELYAKNCAQCHGPTGMGDGPGGKGLNPPPRNLTRAEGWKNGTRRPEIFKTLTEGVKGGAMASFAYLSLRDRMSLVHHVQTLGAFPRPADDPALLVALSGELARAAETIPNRIPLRMALAKLEREYSEPRPLQSPSADDVSPGAVAFREAVTDPARAARVLAASNAWREGGESLARTVLQGTPANGFSVRAAALGPGEWQALHSRLIKG